MIYYILPLFFTQGYAMFNFTILEKIKPQIQDIQSSLPELTKEISLETHYLIYIIIAFPITMTVSILIYKYYLQRQKFRQTDTILLLELRSCHHAIYIPILEISSCPIQIQVQIIKFIKDITIKYGFFKNYLQLKDTNIILHVPDVNISTRIPKQIALPRFSAKAIHRILQREHSVYLLFSHKNYIFTIESPRQCIIPTIFYPMSETHVSRQPNAPPVYES